MSDKATEETVRVVRDVEMEITVKVTVEARHVLALEHAFRACVPIKALLDVHVPHAEPVIVAGQVLAISRYDDGAIGRERRRR